jgi:hypothetical protein
MRDLGETLRDQQELSDDAFRDLQGVPRPGEELGDGQGQEQGQGQGEDTDTQDGNGTGR